MDDPSPYPLLFTPILKEKVWGGRRLQHLGKRLPEGALIGESWEIADLAATSPTGGGGDAARSIICNGPLRGWTLAEAIRLWGEELLGDAALIGGGFPLLVKYLDARENLSVQAHPSPAYAQKHPGATIKHEAWCVIDAEPGSLIYRGMKPGITQRDLVDRLAQNTIAEALVAHPAKAGDIYVLPSGIVHALGAGVLVAEVQTPSDTTFRLDDWGRRGRALHIKEALSCIFDKSGEYATATESVPPVSNRFAATDGFVMRRITLPAAGRRALDDMDDPHGKIALLGKNTTPILVMTLTGSGRIEWPNSAGEELPLRTGDTTLIPAHLPSPRLFSDQGATFLVVVITQTQLTEARS